MFKDELRQLQPVAYRILENSLRNEKLAHAYMFHGPSGTPKKEAAYLLAKSLVCGQAGFACEGCAVCDRIEHGNYADLLYIDGTVTTIKKQDIIALQHAFYKTGIEEGGQKIYIIDHAENATADALNSLLKFLEEPDGAMTAILIVEQLDRMLPTILSRCQMIPFQSLTQGQCYQMVRKDLDEINAYLLSSMIRDPKEILKVSESEDYQYAFYLFKGFLNEYKETPYRALLFLQLESAGKKQKLNKINTGYFIRMLDIFFRDCLSGQPKEDPWYQKTIDAMHMFQIDYTKMIRILLNVQDTLLRSVNIPLLMDQMVYEMKEATK